MSVSVPLRAAVEVPAAATATWAAAVDWARQGEWMLATRVASGPSAAGPAAAAVTEGVGAQLAAYTGLGRFGFLDTMEITEWDPPRRCAVRHTGRVVRGTGTFEVVPVSGDRSRFVWAEYLEVPGGRVGARLAGLVAPILLAAVRLSLTRFARWVPRRGGTPAGC